MGKKITSLFFVLSLVLVVFFSSSVVYADDPTPTTGACTDIAPTVAPNLYQITPGQGSATLYFSPPSGSYTGFLITYGLDESANTYNATVSQGATTGAITYTVNSLSPNTKYYFKVQALNNCASGPFSSVLSTTSTVSNSTSSSALKGSVKPPVTGPEDVLYFGIAALLLSLGGFGVFIKNK